MKKILALLLLVPSLAFGQGWQVPYPAGTPRALPTPGTVMTKANVNTFGDQRVVLADPSGGSAAQNTVNVVATPGATSFLKAEDAPHASGDTGIQNLGVAQDVNSLTSFVGAYGDYTPLGVNLYGAGLSVINFLTQQGSQAQYLLKQEDSVSASGDALVGVAAIRNDNATATYAGTDQDYSPIAVDANGKVWVRAPIGASDLAKGEDIAAASSDVGVASLFVARDPIIASTVSATNDYINPITDLNGRTITTLAPAGESFTNCSTSATGVVDVAIKAAVASNRSYVTSITCSNTAAAVSTELEIRDGTTVMDVGYVASTTLGQSHWTKTYPVPLRGTVNTALNVRPVTTSSATRCCAQGYISVN